MRLAVQSIRCDEIFGGTCQGDDTPSMTTMFENMYATATPLGLDFIFLYSWRAAIRADSPFVADRAHPAQAAITGIVVAPLPEHAASKIGDS